MIDHRPIIRVAITATLLSCLGACATASVGDNSANSTDTGITEQVRTAIYKHAEFAGDEISVQTRDGVVYLYGLVDTNVERDTAESIARAIPGVKRIVDSIKLRNFR
jgi:osmotically-inducible protein OsmY